MTRYSRDVQRLIDRRTNLKAKEGALVSIVVDELNDVEWTFKYRKNALTKYKWKFVGGGILMAEAKGVVSPLITSTTYVADANGPIVSIPFAGRFDTDYGAQMSQSTVGQWVLASPQWAGPSTSMTVAADADAVNNAANGTGQPLSFAMKRLFEIQPLVALQLFYRVTGGTGTVQSRYIGVRPQAVIF